MKKKFTSILLICFLLSFSQEENINLNDHVSTTLVEYNYITKGYKDQIEKGLDVKLGYSLIDVQKVKFGNSNYYLRWLMHINTKKIKATMISVNDKIFFCLPVNNQELMNKFYQEINKYGGDTINPIIYLIGIHYNFIASNYKNLKEQIKE
jgi:hypothetical protein